VFGVPFVVTRGPGQGGRHRSEEEEQTLSHDHVVVDADKPVTNHGGVTDTCSRHGGSCVITVFCYY